MVAIYKFILKDGEFITKAHQDSTGLIVFEITHQRDPGNTYKFAIGGKGMLYLYNTDKYRMFNYSTQNMIEGQV